MEYKIILSKSKNTYSESLHDYIPHSTIIYDSEIHESNCCCLTETIKKSSAWDKAFSYIINDQEYLLNTYNYFYFIEDDVYAKDLDIFNKLFLSISQYNYDLIAHDVRLKQDSKHWFWWNKYRKFNIKSFNPLCRLSNKLTKLVIDYYIHHKKFIFHEILFASIAQLNNLSIFDFTKMDNYKEIFTEFRHRPTIDISKVYDNKIHHPVKPIYENI